MDVNRVAAGGLGDGIGDGSAWAGGDGAVRDIRPDRAADVAIGGGQGLADTDDEERAQ